MIIYAHYHPSDAHAVVDFWNSVMGEQFPIDTRLWRQNVDHCKRTLAEASLIARDDEAGNAVVGCLIIKSPKHICAIAVAPEYRRQGVATEMIAMAEQTIGADTHAKWVVGQDYNHFFPGVPEGYKPALEFFENSLGFTRGTGVAAMSCASCRITRSSRVSSSGSISSKPTASKSGRARSMISVR